MIINKKEKATILDYVVCGFIFITIFIFVYYRIDSLTNKRSGIHQLYFQWEQKIPYIPFFYFFYYAILLTPFTVPFFIKYKIGVYTVTIKLIIAFLISAIIFLVYPTKLGYDQSANTHYWIEELTQKIAGKYNLVPSLHVLLIFILFYEFNRETYQKHIYVFLILLALTSLSTLFIHQHHVIDVMISIFLGILINKIPIHKYLITKMKTNG